MRVLVTGSRGWHDMWMIEADLRQFRREAEAMDDEFIVIHGDAPAGADRLARRICSAYHIDQIKEPADWDRYGKGAGPIRNQKMLDDHHPDVVLAYRATGKSNGTDDMVKRARQAGIETIVRTPEAITA